VIYADTHTVVIMRADLTAAERRCAAVCARLDMAVAALRAIAATDCTCYAAPSPPCRERSWHEPEDWCPACVAIVALHRALGRDGMPHKRRER